MESMPFEIVLIPSFTSPFTSSMTAVFFPRKLAVQLYALPATILPLRYTPARLRSSENCISSAAEVASRITIAVAHCPTEIGWNVDARNAIARSRQETLYAGFVSARQVAASIL